MPQSSETRCHGRTGMARKLLRREPGFPPRLPDAELFDLLRQAERCGQLARVEFKGTDRKPRQRWEVTPEGRATAGLAASLRCQADPTSAEVPTSANECKTPIGTRALGGADKCSTL